MAAMTRSWFKRSDDSSFPTSPQSALFSRNRRAQTEGAADRTHSNETGKPWARLTARLRTLSQNMSQSAEDTHPRRSQTPTAEMIHRHQMEDAATERRNHPFLVKNVSRAASTASRRSGLRPPPRRLSTQSSRSDLTHLDSIRPKVPSSILTPSYGHSSLPTPPNSAHPSTTNFSPPERIRRSWSGHPFAARPPGYTPESSETNSDYAPDIGALFSVPELPRIAPLPSRAPSASSTSLGSSASLASNVTPIPMYEPSPPSDHPFTVGRKPRERRGTFGSNGAHQLPVEDILEEYERRR